MSSRALSRIIFLAAFLLVSVHVFAGDDFKPVPPEELAMKDNPQQPGAHAMILEWTDTEDDANQFATHYFRVKIFTEEGKKYADVEIPYFKGYGNINDIKARTIHPDGTVVPFTGKIFDKMVVKTKNVKYQAKTFSLPDVQPGSVIEYKYRNTWEGYGATYWDLQRELFIKRAVFTLKPADIPGVSFAWVGYKLSAKDAVQKKNGGYSLELTNVAGFETERLAPPEHELKPHIDFFYTLQQFQDAEKFWKKIGQDKNKEIEEFIGHRGGIQTAAYGMVAPNDPAEVKLRKIYAKVQEIKNLSFTAEKTEQEAKRDKLKDINNVEDVLKRGYGHHHGINRLYAALVRGAGMDADVILVSERDRYFFKKSLLDVGQLNGEIVLVHAGGKEYYLDPGTPMCPFGLLSWKNTGVQAYHISKDGGTFLTTPQPQSATAVTRRLAALKFDETSIKGSVQVTYFDQEALHWRLGEVTSDEVELKTDLENDMKALLPGGSKVTLASIENAKDENQPLIVRYTVDMPFTGSTVGSRLLMPMEVFQSNNRNPFLHEKRVYPVYYEYPFQELDEVSIEMPEQFKVENLPAAKKNQTQFGYYDATWSQDGNRLIMHRRMAIMGILMPTQIYPDIRSFYEQVNGNDQESVVLRAQK